MKKKDAIRILQEQNSKVQTNEDLCDPTLRTQTKSYIKKIFGEDSPEFEFIKSFQSYDHMSKEWNIAKMKSFLERCIETVKNQGVYTPPVLNLLHSIPNEWVIGSLTLLLSGIGTLAFIAGETKASVNSVKQEMRIKELEDSLRIRPALSIPYSVPAKDTNRN